MLQLLPALLLLMMQGPATLNRGALADRMPDAIRLLLELRAPDDESETETALEESQDPDWSSASTIELSTALAHLLGLDISVQTAPDFSSNLDDFAPRIGNCDPPHSLRSEIGSRAHPCRAGPVHLAA